MIDYAELLKNNSHGVLATRNGDKVETRVFHCLFAEEGKVYFCTNSGKSVYAQLVANPSASFCAYPRDFTPVLSVNGTAVFVEDPETRKRAFESFPMNAKMYGSHENPAFKVFYIEAEEFRTYTFAEGTISHKA